MITHGKTFAIMGAGIGGLTLAIAMQRKGYDVTVYENAPTIKPLGAGLVLAANAVKAFAEIDIVNDVLAFGKVISKVKIKDNNGKVLTETDSLKISEQFGVINNFTIHRADLHSVLLNKLIEGTLQLGKCCTHFEQNTHGVKLHFANGSVEYADYLIAADGIHSVIRKQLIPESSPRYAGYTCYRAVIDLPPGFDIDETSETWGSGCRFGIVPLLHNRLYWFACINAMAGDHQMQAFKIQDLLTYFSAFHDPVPAILKSTTNEKLICGDIMDLKPLSRFAFGNVVLLGDAAHATTPNMGQGACMAIEDAVVLANCVDSFRNTEEAFSAFEKKRISRTTKIVNTSWMIGKLAQLESPVLRSLRNAAMKLTPSYVATKQLKFLYDVSFN